MLVQSTLRLLGTQITQMVEASQWTLSELVYQVLLVHQVTVLVMMMVML
jgi:hypothetical protein